MLLREILVRFTLFTVYAGTDGCKEQGMTGTQFYFINTVSVDFPQLLLVLLILLISQAVKKDVALHKKPG